MKIFKQVTDDYFETFIVKLKKKNIWHRQNVLKNVKWLLGKDSFKANATFIVMENRTAVENINKIKIFQDFFE